MAFQYKDHSLHFSVANRQDFMDELEEEYGLSATEGSDVPFVTVRTQLGHKYIMREEFTYVQPQERSVISDNKINNNV